MDIKLNGHRHGKNQAVRNEIIEALKNLTKPKPRQDFMIHIDDALHTLRKFRRDGFTIERGRSPYSGTKTSTFHMYLWGNLATILYIDTTRSLERGKWYIMPKEHNPLLKRKIEFEHHDFKLDDWWIGRWRFDTEWKIGNDPFKTSPD